MTILTRRAFPALVSLTLSLLLFACSDSTIKPDSGNDAARDVNNGGETAPADSGVDAADAAADAFVAKHEHTIQYGSGVPALRLGPITGLLDIRVEPPAAQLPVKLQKVALVPFGVFRYSVEIITWSGVDTAPISTLTRVSATSTASEVGKFTEIDLSDKNLVFNGPFYVRVSIDDPLSATATGALSFSSSGQTVRVDSQGLLTAEHIEADLLARITYAAAAGDAPAAQGDDRASCTHAHECKSGYCVAVACTIACPSAGCGSGRRCVTFGSGAMICMPDCSAGQTCPAGSLCLRRVHSKRGNFLVEAFDPGGICVRAGPKNVGDACKDQYDSICKTGYCTACELDADCSVDGTCQPKPAGGGDGSASDGGSGG